MDIILTSLLAYSIWTASKRFVFPCRTLAAQARANRACAGLNNHNQCDSNVFHSARPQGRATGATLRVSPIPGLQNKTLRTASATASAVEAALLNPLDPSHMVLPLQRRPSLTGSLYIEPALVHRLAKPDLFRAKQTTSLQANDPAGSTKYGD